MAAAMMVVPLRRPVDGQQQVDHKHKVAHDEPYSMVHGKSHSMVHCSVVNIKPVLMPLPGQRVKIRIRAKIPKVRHSCD